MMSDLQKQQQEFLRQLSQQPQQLGNLMGGFFDPPQTQLYQRPCRLLHRWDKWQTPEWIGTRFVQRRFCHRCNLTQFKILLEKL